MIGVGNDEEKQEPLTIRDWGGGQCVKTITLTNTASLVRTIIRWDIGMTRKCVSTTSAVRTVQGKVVTALLRMMIFPQSKEGSHRRGCCHERSGAELVHPLEADQAAQILRRPDERVRC